MLNWMRDPAKIGGIPEIRVGLQRMAEFVSAALGPATIMFEVGSFAGESMEIMAPYFGVVHCVDPWIDPCGSPGIEAVERSFDERAEIAGNVVKHKMGSEEAANLVADDSLDFVYIDAGDHSRDVTSRDIKAWYPKVKAGGYIGGHDFEIPELNADAKFPGVAEAIHDFFGRGPDRVFLDTSWIIRK